MPQPLPKQSRPENLDRPAHRASQPNRVSDTSAGDPGLQHPSTIDSPGEFHPPGARESPWNLRNLNQGNELWDFNLVDPDNRRPVDYVSRVEMLNTLLPMLEDRAEDLDRQVADLLTHAIDGHHIIRHGTLAPSPPVTS